MNTIEAIKNRKSIRKFTSQPVPQETIKEILEIAVRAPSAENTQPWEFIVLGGDVLNNIKQGNVEKIKKLEFPPQEMAHLIVDRGRGSIYHQRQVEIAKQLFKLMDIPREDKAKRAEWLERGFRYFDAPTAIIITADKSLPLPGTFFDIGTVAQTICLAALEFGLSTCIENQGVTYSDVLRQHADIPDSKMLMVAIAIGYADPDFPANKVESRRESIDNIVTWRTEA